MKDLVNGALGFIVIAVVLAIGGGIVVLTNEKVTALVTNSTPLQQIITNTVQAITTFSSVLPIVAIALIGGLAIAYIMGFIGRE